MPTSEQEIPRLGIKAMSKTNHGRNFVATRFALGQRSHHAYYKRVREVSLDGTMLIACGDIFRENAKGIRRSRAGAKHYVHSRRRRRDRDFLIKEDFASEHE